MVIKKISREAKARVNISQPKVFSSYNSGMGGVDIHDQCISLYRIAVKGKKWWWVLFTYMLDMCISNAWKLHEMTTKSNLNQMEFRRSVSL